MAYKIGNLTIETVRPVPCLRLVQYGKGLPITCACPRCAARGQTPAEALASVKAAHA